MKTIKKEIQILIGMLLICVVNFNFAQENIIANTEVSNLTVTQKENVISYITSSKEHTTLLVAIKAAGLEETLSGDGPFTLFAPTNTAFSALPAGKLKSLLKPENIEQLKSILTYHVVSGNNNALSIAKSVRDNDGETDLKTVNGNTISAYTKGGTVILTDEHGNDANIQSADINQSNGIIHVIDRVVLPGNN